MMSGSIEKAVDHAMKYGAVFAEVGGPIFTKNKQDIDTY